MSRMFGVKDVFTTINVLGGAVGMCLCVEGHPFAAGIAVMIGYLIGDTLDGYIARKTGTANEFGVEYDTIADHVGQCLAPAAIVFTVYRNAELGLPPKVTWVIALLLSSAIVVAASIRHARNVVKPVRYKGVWAGLPRSVLGFLCISVANSALLPFVQGGIWVGVILIPILCVATLTYAPFPNHHLPRGHFWYVKVLIALFFLSNFAVLALRPAFFFDVVLFWSIGYCGTGWMSLTIDERKKYREAVELALGKSA